MFKIGIPDFPQASVLFTESLFYFDLLVLFCISKVLCLERFSRSDNLFFSSLLDTSIFFYFQSKKEFKPCIACKVCFLNSGGR